MRFCLLVTVNGFAINSFVARGSDPSFRIASKSKRSSNAENCVRPRPVINVSSLTFRVAITCTKSSRWPLPVRGVADCHGSKTGLPSWKRYSCDYREERGQGWSMGKENMEIFAESRGEGPERRGTIAKWLLIRGQLRWTETSGEKLVNLRFGI